MRAWPVCPSSACMASVLQFSMHGQCAPVQHARMASVPQFSMRAWPVCSSSARMHAYGPVQHAWLVCPSSACMAMECAPVQHAWPVCPSSACIAMECAPACIAMECAPACIAMECISVQHAWPVQHIMVMECAPVQHAWPWSVPQFSMYGQCANGVPQIIFPWIIKHLRG